LEKDRFRDGPGASVSNICLGLLDLSLLDVPLLSLFSFLIFPFWEDWSCGPLTSRLDSAVEEGLAGPAGTLQVEVVSGLVNGGNDVVEGVALLGVELSAQKVVFPTLSTGVEPVLQVSVACRQSAFCDI
jgi:hypothetical protein